MQKRWKQEEVERRIGDVEERNPSADLEIVAHVCLTDVSNSYDNLCDRNK